MLSIFPSIGTGVCQASVRRFNELASGLENTTVLNVSVDLPLAELCATLGITDDVVQTDGKVVAQDPSGGKVKRGTKVTKGAVLIRLSDAETGAQAKEAEANAGGPPPWMASCTASEGRSAGIASPW